MPRSHTSSHRSHGIWPKAAPVHSITQIAILLAIAVAAIFAINRASDASRSRVATDAPVSTAADCAQLAETFDNERAACLRRRWSAMRGMKAWRDGPENALLEECLRSPGGDAAVPFKTNSCNQKGTPRLQRAQN